MTLDQMVQMEDACMKELAIPSGRQISLVKLCHCIVIEKKEKKQCIMEAEVNVQYFSGRTERAWYSIRYSSNARLDG